MINDMKEYVKRMVKESEELEERINKLHAFMQGEAYAALPEEKRDLMTSQFFAMVTYSNILNQRLKNELREKAAGDAESEGVRV